MLTNQSTVDNKGLPIPYHAMVLKFTPDGVQSSSWTAPTNSGVINDLELDDQGNVWVAGTSSAGDVSAVNCKIPSPPTAHGFFMKLDLSLATILISARFGDSTTEASAITVDANGNVYVGGKTMASAFPDAFNPSPPPVEDRPPSYAFAIRIPATMDRIDYSVLLGGPTQTCSEGGFGYSFCRFEIGTLAGSSRTTALAIDASGELIMGGYTASVGFPTTPGAFVASSDGLTNVLINYVQVSGFVAKLNATGSALVYSTCVGDRYQLGEGDFFTAMQLAADGNVVFAGTGYVPVGLFGISYYSPFVAKLNSTGTGVIFWKLFCGTCGIGTADWEVGNFWFARDPPRTPFLLFLFREHCPDKSVNLETPKPGTVRQCL